MLAVNTGGLRRLLVAAASALALASCRGEGPTGIEDPYPFDIILERRETSEGPGDLYRLSLEDGEDVRLLTGAVAGVHPSGSPVNSLVAFVRTDAEFTGEIFSVDGNGTGLTNLTSNAAFDQMPAWSPNAQQIAFVSNRGGFDDIFVMNANGTNVRRVTPPDPAGVVTTEWWPAWHPTQQVIAYSSTLEGTADIWTIAVDVTPFERSLLTSGPDNDFHPTWSPDGQRIAFQRIDANTGEADIVILTLSSGVLQTIDLPGQQLWPSWSPEGDLIAFASNHLDENFEIYTMSPNGGDIVRRTSNGVQDLRPTWIVRDLPD